MSLASGVPVKAPFAATDNHAGLLGSKLKVNTSKFGSVADEAKEPW